MEARTVARRRETMTDATPLTTSDDAPDEIVRSIHIEADLDTVWALVTEPGWFINDGTWTDHEVTTDDGVAHVVDPVCGAFTIGTDLLEPPHRAVFRWLGGIGGSLEDFPNNVIEFTLEAEGDGVLLTVRESGFAQLSDDAIQRRKRYEENAEGWITELEIARRRLEGE